MLGQAFDRVTVHTTARLHLGFIDLHGGLNRIYGSLGVALNEPVCMVEVKRLPDGLEVGGEDVNRAKAIAEKVIQHFEPLMGFQIVVRKSIPEHVGLGSGTQLSLAIGTGILMLCDKQVPIPKLGQILNRGSVSGIGTALFSEGGFVIDSGKPSSSLTSENSPVPSPLIRFDIPEDWYFVVAIPNVTKGLSGKQEERAFQNLPSGKASQAQEISRLVLMKLLPALVEDNIERFGEALTRIQILVGDAFASTQGGRFAAPEVADCVEAMLGAGADGAGQSSWGPACYGLVRDIKIANSIKNAVSKILDSANGGLIYIATVNNHGAIITTD